MAGKVELGDLAKDVITGFTGIVKAISKYQHNCERVGIQPCELKDGKPIDTIFFDGPGVEVIEKEKIVNTIYVKPMIFGFGDLVADTVTDFKGTVTAYCQWINGCTRVGVQSAKLKDGNPVDEHWLPMGQLKLIKAAKKSPLTEGAVQHEKKPGGPMSAPAEMRSPR
jgi:hypothetical protein